MADRAALGIGARVHSSAPVRTADAGGWTDTWFATTGCVCNVAIDHRAEVTLAVDGDGSMVRLRVAMTGQDYRFRLDRLPGAHPIVEGALAALPVGRSITVDIADSIEPGSGLGTSAAVMVALVAALTAARGEPLVPAIVASEAHRLETATGKQSGVQDHWAAAFGGVSLLDVRYPRVVHHRVALTPASAGLLARSLHTVYFGSPHTSSALHEEVIARLETEGAPVALDRMRAAAAAAAAALTIGDAAAYGSTLRDNHEAIRLLHPGLVSTAADELADLAHQWGARGWKVNGAGGEGGSMVVLGPADPDRNAALCEAIDAQLGWRRIVAPLAERGAVAEVHPGPEAG